LENLADIQQLQQFDHLEFLAREIVEGFITGLHRSPFHGFSVEFAEHRLYNRGESTKHIDWKLYARTDKMFVKKYEEETNLRSQIVIDTSSSMQYPMDEKIRNKLTFSSYCAAALIYLLRKQRDAVGLTLFSEEIELQTHARLSPAHANMLFDHLGKLILQDKSKGNKKTAASRAIHTIAESIHQRSLVIIFSDMMDDEKSDDLFQALQHLRHNKHEVILFHVTDRQRELEFDFKNRPYRFVDLESGEEIKLNPNEIRDQYVASMRNFTEELKLRCAQYRIDLIEADITEPFAKVLFNYLIKRSRLI
jgi:uncharacterized protein (DUF58 family)